MNPLRRIRKDVLGLSQAEMATVSGVTQPTVSKWENGELSPSRDELALIRKEATDRGIEWNDAWFFEQPSGAGQ